MLRFVLFVVLVFPAVAGACDSCGCALTPVDERSLTTGWRAGVAQQFTLFDRLQDSGNRVANDEDQEIKSFLTQVSVGYQLDERDSVQVDFPFLKRRFRRLVDGNLQQGDVDGLGDITLSGTRVVTLKRHADSLVIGRVRAGVKLPTGDTGFLGEQAAALNGTGPDSVVGGHDLTLGTGSTDAQLGASFYGRWHRAMLTATVLREIRGTGAFDYQFADELQWEFSPGWYLDYRSSQALAVQLTVQGLSKSTDTFAGSTPVTDTGVNEVYVGPRLTASGAHLSALVDWQTPVHELNTDLQLVPRYRTHFSLLWRF